MPLPKVTFEPGRPGPLDGVRVLDFSRLVAGNMLSLQLADFGSEVVKVETPGRGDTLRDWREAGVSVHWKVYARNKKSITLNLKAPEAPGIVLDLVPHFDVLIESFRFGYLERLGVAPAVLLARHPRLVIVRVSGFGQTGPYRKRPGFGTLIEAMSGFASRNGFEDREPVLPPLAMADMVAGLYGAMATVIAVRHAERDGGRGQVIDLSLLDSIFSILGPDAAIHKLTRRVRRRTGSATESQSPRNVYATKDGGWVAISASTQAMTERLFRAIGRGDLNDDPRFKTNAERIKRREEVDGIVGGFIVERTLADRKLTLSISAEARRYLARIGYDPDFGARPLKRTLQRRVQNPLAMRLLKGEFKPGDTVVVDFARGEFQFRAGRHEPAVAASR